MGLAKPPGLVPPHSHNGRTSDGEHHTTTLTATVSEDRDGGMFWDEGGEERTFEVDTSTGSGEMPTGRT
jgi:hypothetical protein